MTAINAYQRLTPTKKAARRHVKNERLRMGAGAYWGPQRLVLCGVVRGLAALPDFEVVLFDATEESDDWLTGLWDGRDP